MTIGCAFRARNAGATTRLMLVAATGGQFLGGDNEHSSRHRSCCRHCRMAYTPPSRDEIRYLIQVHWRQHADPSKQSNADDADFVEAKVASTQHLLQRFYTRRNGPPRSREPGNEVSGIGGVDQSGLARCHGIHRGARCGGAANNTYARGRVRLVCMTPIARCSAQRGQA